MIIGWEIKMNSAKVSGLNSAKTNSSSILSSFSDALSLPSRVQMSQNRAAGQVSNVMTLQDEVTLQADLINLQDYAPKIVLGNLPDGRDELTPPFYITLELQNIHLHNCLYDSGASHSLMPLAVMEKLGLDITRPYKNLYSFYSKRVQCLGMIKDLVVRMVQIPRNFVMMDVVIADVPPTYGMLLSKHWGTSMGGMGK